MRGPPRSPPKRLRSPSEARLSTGTRSVSAGWGGGGGGRGGSPTHLPSRLPGLGESEQEPPPPPHPSATRAAAAAPPSARASPLKADRGRAQGAKRKEASGDGDASFPPAACLFARVGFSAASSPPSPELRGGEPRPNATGRRCRKGARQRRLPERERLLFGSWSRTSFSVMPGPIS
ncbi:CDC42 small effector protein 2 isoform X1 [Podarcis muralis]